MESPTSAYAAEAHLAAERDLLLLSWARHAALLEKIERLDSFAAGAEMTLALGRRRPRIAFEAIGLSPRQAMAILKGAWRDQVAGYVASLQRYIEHRFGVTPEVFDQAMKDYDAGVRYERVSAE